MKFSYNWLRELVNGLDVNPRELGELITMKTAECEGVAPYAPWLERVCAARVTALAPIPGSKNRKVTVETGRFGARTVVCGAPNIRVGMITAYVPAGVALDGREVRRLEIQGVTSDGMLASGGELGINRDADGILDLDAAPGDSIPGCAPDFIIEIDNKSITHRPDLWGHHGLAREVAAIAGRPLRDPVSPDALPAAAPDIAIEIENFDLCPRYSALTFDDVTVGPSPLWMQYRLSAIGLNPISNIVDVTNWIMSEISEPMHAFDRDALQGPAIVVRRARPGEFLTVLNGETCKLDGTNLVIADARGPVAVAGVMGGLDSAVIATTRRIVLESANFHAASVRRTSAKLKLRTDASMRFEKAQDPANTVRGLARAVELLRIVSPGVQISGGLADVKKKLPAPPRIALDMEWLARKLGRSIALTEVRSILEALQFGVTEEGAQRLSVSVPSWRATRDISIKDDLVEEVGRMIGYSSIPPQPPLIAAMAAPRNEDRAFHRDVRAAVAAQGFTEVYNYSFLSDEMVREMGLDPAAHLRVVNPIAAGQNLMRASLVPGIVKNIRSNARHFDNFRLFEIGYEIHPRAAAPADAAQPAPLPDEVDHLAAAIFAREGDGAAGLFEVKRLAECLMPGASVSPAEPRVYEHPRRTYAVWWRGAAVGRIFELHPRILAEGRAAVLDIHLGVMRAAGPVDVKYRPLRRFPASAFDLSVVAGLRELAGDVEQRLASLARPNLESIAFVRQYTGSPLPADRKSLSYRLTVSAPDHTLTAEEVNAVRQRIIDGMRDSGYELRV